MKGASFEQDLKFSVTETGIRIPPEYGKTTLAILDQVTLEIARIYGGVGLGLSLVQRLTELHGGRLSVVSEHGKGGTFAISLPLQ